MTGKIKSKDMKVNWSVCETLRPARGVYIGDSVSASQPTAGHSWLPACAGVLSQPRHSEDLPLSLTTLQMYMHGQYIVLHLCLHVCNTQ